MLALGQAAELLQKLNDRSLPVQEPEWSVLKADALVTVGLVPSRIEPGYGHILPGEQIRGPVYRIARFVEKPPRGATFDRRVEFVNAAGKVIVSANTTWAMLDRASGRLMRVPAEVAAPFLTSA